MYLVDDPGHQGTLVAGVSDEDLRWKLEGCIPSSRLLRVVEERSCCDSPDFGVNHATMGRSLPH